MSFYDYDTEQINLELLPPQLRQPKHIAWLKVLLTPLQWVRDLFFDSYIAGSSAPEWGAFTLYAIGDRVLLGATVYEAINPNFFSGPATNTTDWIKVKDVYIGVDERLKYNAQIIVFEYALNKWFKNIGATDQIYIENNTTNGTQFYLANRSELSGTMSNDSFASTVFMGNTSAALNPYDYTIYVPAALFATLGSTTQDKENAIRNIADKYNMAGVQYSVETF